MVNRNPPPSPSRLINRILSSAENGNLYSLRQLDSFTRGRGLDDDLKPIEVALVHLHRDLIPNINPVPLSDAMKRAFISLKLINSLCRLADTCAEVSNEDVGTLILSQWADVLTWIRFIITEWCPSQGRSCEDALRALQLCMGGLLAIFGLGDVIRDQALANDATLEAVVLLYTYHDIGHIHYPFLFKGGDPDLSHLCVLDLLSISTSTPGALDQLFRIIDHPSFTQDTFVRFTLRRLMEMEEEASTNPDNLPRLLKALTSLTRILSRVVPHRSLRDHLLQQQALRAYGRALGTIGSKCLHYNSDWDAVLRCAEHFFFTLVAQGNAIQNLEELLSGEGGFIQFLVRCIVRPVIDIYAEHDGMDCNDDGSDDSDDDIYVSDREDDDSDVVFLGVEHPNPISDRASLLLGLVAHFSVYTPVAKVVQRALTYTDPDNIKAIQQMSDRVRCRWSDIVEASGRTVRQTLSGRTIGVTCDNLGHVFTNRPLRIDAASTFTCDACGSVQYCSQECAGTDLERYHSKECPVAFPHEMGNAASWSSMKSDQLNYLEDLCNTNSTALDFMQTPLPEGPRRMLFVDATAIPMTVDVVALNEDGPPELPDHERRAGDYVLEGNPTIRLVIARFMTGEKNVGVFARFKYDQQIGSVAISSVLLHESMPNSYQPSYLE